MKRINLLSNNVVKICFVVVVSILFVTCKKKQYATLNFYIENAATNKPEANVAVTVYREEYVSQFKLFKNNNGGTKALAVGETNEEGWYKVTIETEDKDGVDYWFQTDASHLHHYGSNTYKIIKDGELYDKNGSSGSKTFKSIYNKNGINTCLMYYIPNAAPLTIQLTTAPPYPEGDSLVWTIRHNVLEWSGNWGKVYGTMTNNGVFIIDNKSMGDNEFIYKVYHNSILTEEKTLKIWLSESTPNYLEINW